ncbi:MAG: hypothetical protein GF353_05475 [Candidatus Lokiarchaeota archaeon]|nr:hypothetical protein [Candidatus Lokiarchaeota archaeon]
MVKTIPYLKVKNANKSINFYKKLFNAELIDHVPYSEEVGKEFGLPSDFDYENSTMHSVLHILGAPIYMADEVLEPLENAKGKVEILLDLDNKEQIEEIYQKAKELGCSITMELEQMFWGAHFASFEDPDGIKWQLHFQAEN